MMYVILRRTRSTPGYGADNTKSNERSSEFA